MKFDIEVDYLDNKILLQLEADSFSQAFDTAFQVPKILAINPADEKPQFKPGGFAGTRPTPDEVHKLLRDTIEQTMKRRFGKDVIIEEVLLRKPNQRTTPETASEDVAGDLLAMKKHLTGTLNLLSNNDPAFTNISTTLSVLMKAIEELKSLRQS